MKKLFIGLFVLLGLFSLAACQLPIEIPGLKPEQHFSNLMPSYGDACKFQNNKNGTITVELGASRACVFEIDDADIQKLSRPENVLQQKYL